MRDFALTIFVVGLIPFAIAKPYIGALGWAWISMMNPHKMTWGFAFSLPFAMMMAIATLVGLFLTRDRCPIPWKAPTVFMLLFYLWTGVTSLNGIGHPAAIMDMWVKLTKIFLMLFVTMMLVQSRKRIELLVWVIVVSIGYFGFKGGLFTLLGGGSERVWGPPGGMVEGNNEIGLALIVVVPLMHALAQLADTSAIVPFGVNWVKRILWAGMGFSCIAILGTHSRGALLGILGMVMLFALKSKHKILSMMIVAAGLGLALNFMPEHWWSRMGSIATHEDGSAQQRLQAWVLHWNLALDRPVVGGGTEFLTNAAALFQYDPTELGHRAAHSIYFQVLGEHGFVGLLLYVVIGISAWRLATRTIRCCSGVAELEWATQLLRMLQVGMFGFAVGGGFLSLVNWDVPYYLAAIIVLIDAVVRRTHPSLFANRQRGLQRRLVVDRDRVGALVGAISKRTK